jgi:hypothetical protein
MEEIMDNVKAPPSQEAEPTWEVAHLFPIQGEWSDRIIVLRLEEAQYTVHGEFGPGQQATSALLQGFIVDVAAVFAAAV